MAREQYLALLHKMVKTHEGISAGIADTEVMSKHRPSEEEWIISRIIIQLWGTSIQECAKADLSAEDYKTLEHLVTETDTLNKELCSIRNRWCKWFHMGLMPSLLGEDDAGA